MTTPSPITVSAPTTRDGVDDHVLAEADAFLTCLSPRHGRWNDPLGWIFRGHADAEWELKSKAARTTSAFEEFGVPGAASDWSSRSDMQNVLLETFRDGLNRAGMVIPMRAPRVRIPNEITHPGAEPPREAFPLMALAQHHGLPTMLLDWTRRGWVAAYFAAVEASDPRKPHKGTHLAVWALHRNGFGKSWRDESIFYDAPGGTNPNLNAQAGLFTIHHEEDSPSLETFLLRRRASDATTPVPQRLSLPRSEAPKLLRLLAYEGVTGASLFPGADGVVKAMRERTLWDRP
jgi:hypothetical protein